MSTCALANTSSQRLSDPWSRGRGQRRRPPGQALSRRAPHLQEFRYRLRSGPDALRSAKQPIRAIILLEDFIGIGAPPRNESAIYMRSGGRGRKAGRGRHLPSRGLPVRSWLVPGRVSADDLLDDAGPLLHEDSLFPDGPTSVSKHRLPAHAPVGFRDTELEGAFPVISRGGMAWGGSDRPSASRPGSFYNDRARSSSAESAVALGWL